MARKFFFVAAGMFLIALSFHLGFSTATAQAPANPVVAMASNGSSFVAVTMNGDTYITSPAVSYVWSHYTNVFVGGPIPTQRATWGQVKARYAPSPGTPTTQTNDR